MVDKAKLIRGGMWLSGFTFFVMLSSVSLFKGFSMMREGNYVLLFVGVIFLLPLFYCAYKGFKLILDSIFDS